MVRVRAYLRHSGCNQARLHLANRAVALVLHDEEHRQTQLVTWLDGRVVELLEKLSTMGRVVAGASNLLLELRHIQQHVRVHKPGELRHERHVLRHVERLRAECRIALHEVLHVLNARNVLVQLRQLLVFVEQLLDRRSQITKVRVAVAI